MMKYHYLKKYINKRPDDGVMNNWFIPIPNYIEEILQAEKKASIIFPTSLKTFWKEVGSGQIIRSYYQKLPQSSECYIRNYIFDPETLGNYKEFDGSVAGDYAILDDYGIEMITEKGYFPFFEIGDSSSFLWMKTGSDSVYNELEKVVEEHFEDFIYKLYHVHPQYYLFTEEELKEELDKTK
jgi:hypothetical protein